MKYFLFLLLFCSCFLSAEEKVFTYSFSKGFAEWKGDFCDYPVGEEAFFELAMGWENLPVRVEEPVLGLLTKGLFLSGNNHSDDLFMFVKRQVRGLRPNTRYAVRFSVLIETDIPEEAWGIGGSPGKSVYFKVGASTVEPKKVEVDGYYLLNVDKGDQSQDGTNAVVIGDLEKTGSFDLDYLPKQLESSHSLFVESDSQGRIWIFAGTDSGYEGWTKVYIARIDLYLHTCE